MTNTPHTDFPQAEPWSKLLPSNVASVVSLTYILLTPTLDEHIILTEELRCIEKAVEKRRHEFITGRHCLRTALQAFGRPTHKPILVGDCRAPALEQEYVGTISHCQSYVVAVAGLAKHFHGIGIDVEKNTPLNPGLERLICTPHELHHLNQIITHFLETKASPLPFDLKKLVFSIKESFYKAYMAQVGHYFDFQDAEVTFLCPDKWAEKKSLGLHEGTCRIRLKNALGHKPYDPRTYLGHFYADADFMYTAVCIPKLHLVEGGQPLANPNSTT